MGRRLYLGTESGIVVPERSNSGYEKASVALEGKFVEKLEVSEAGFLVAGLPGDGVYRAQSHRGPWRRTLEADVRGLGISPHDPHRVFAGAEPAGVFRSVDGGETWEELGAVKELPSYSSWWFPAPPHVAHIRTFGFDMEGLPPIWVIRVGWA